MKISKQSWHYKANLWDYPHNNLCQYFWQVALSIGVRIVGWGLLLLAGFICLFILSYPFLIGFNVAEVTFNMHMMISSIVGWLISMTLVGYYIDYRYYDNRLVKYLKRRKKAKENKEPGLVGAYLKAKKEKICPVLEFK
jgi:hypothetical protein